MFGTQDDQQLGWRFLVTRSTNNGPYLTTYKGPIQKRIGSPTQEGDSASCGLVELPNVQNPDLIRYRITFKMFRYNPDRSLQTKETDPMPHHFTRFDGVQDDLGLDFCPSYAHNNN